MRILFVVPEARGHGGGIHTFYRQLLPALAREHECHVISGSGVEVADQPSIDIDEAGVTYHALDLERFRRYQAKFSRYVAQPDLRNHLAAAWAIHEIGESLVPDVVEASDWGLLFVPWVLSQRVPTAVQLHGSCGQIARFDPIVGQEVMAALTQSIEQSTMPLASARLANSRANQAAWAQLQDAPVTHILPAWRPAIAQAASAPDQVFRVFGRFQRWKGIEVMCQALASMSEPTAVEWYGRDTVFGELGLDATAAISARYPGVIGESLMRQPPVSQEVVYALQGSALGNIVPSRWDTFNFTVAEAMASGRPLICAQGAGASQLIEDGVNGFIFPVDDAGALADAMSRLCAMPEPARLEMAARAYETVRRELDPDRIGAARISHFREMLAGFSPRTVSPWVSDLAGPGMPAEPDWRFLEQIPLGALLPHVYARLMSRARHKLHL